MKYKTSKISELFTLAGDFSPITGAPEILAEGGFAYKSEILGITSEQNKHSSGVTVRNDVIKNVSDKPVTLRVALSKFTFSGGEYEVYTQYSQWCAESQGRWQELNTEISVSNSDIRANAGSAPFVAIYNRQNGRGVAFHIVADSTFEIRVRREFRQQRGWVKNVTVELGFRERGFNCVLQAGESLKLPKILFYEFENKTDMSAFKLHRYYNEILPARSLPVVYNTWLSRLDNISYEILSEQLEKAKYIGAEYFVIDAGWFGEPGKWYDSVGDWEECTAASMKGRMKEFADKVRAEGLKFGLWFEIERASVSSKAFKTHPEHYLTEGGFAFVNFASEDTCNYIFDILSKLVKKYGIEFIKFDYNAELTYDPENRDFIKFFEGYNGFIKKIRDTFPSLYLENCASGGMRMALSALETGFDSIWISDNHSLYEQLRIYKDTVLRMPSRSLERWITVGSTEISTRKYDGSGKAEKILVSGDSGWGHVEAINADYLKACTVGGPIGVTCDLTKCTDNLIELLKNHIAEYKNERDFWKNSECHILCDTETMLVLQFCDKNTDKIKIFSYAEKPNQTEVTVYPYVQAGKVYTNNGNGISAEELCENGVTLVVGDRYCANAIMLESVNKM